jgi:thiol-disulfide isomerase/thioredoxin
MTSKNPALAARRLLAALSLLLAGLAQAAAGPDALFAATLNDLEQRAVALEKYRGKPLIVNFWARWCGPCRVEIPELAKLHEKYQARGLVVLGIGLEEQPDSARDFAKAYEMTYPVLLGDNRKTLWLMQTLGNARGGLPFTVAIDRGGQIVSRKLGLMTAADLEAAAQALLK